MSLKIYNGIKFKSRDLPEIVSQLYAIKEQAKKNSNNNLINDGGRIVHLMVKNKIIDNFEDIFTKGFTSDDYRDVDRLITASLDSRWRDRMEPNFNFNVCVIPPTSQEIAEYEEKERKLQEEFSKKIEKMTEDWIRSEFKRNGFDRIDWTQSLTSVETM